MRRQRMGTPELGFVRCGVAMPWTQDESGGWAWHEPRWTLGPDIADWAEANFKVPGGKYAGEPLVFTGWQLMFLADWYSVDERGRWVYGRGLARLAKKSGKSPLGGVIVAAAFAGPSVFDGWDASGNPVGRPHSAPWVQVMAVSEDQTANTFSPFRLMIRESPLVDELGLDVGVSAVTFRGRRESMAEVVTAAAVSREGQPTTDVVGDEGQSWTPSNGGKKLYRTARRNSSPMGGRVLMLANAPEPGVQSVAEDIEKAADTEPGCYVLGPQYEAQNTDLANVDQVRRNLGAVYRDAPWVDVEAIARDVMTADQDPFEVQRFYFNWPVGAGSVLSAKPPTEVDDLPVGSPVALGFQGSRTHEAVALVAVHMETGAAYLLGSWARPVGHPKRDPWEAPRSQVVDAVAAAFSRFTVARMAVNVSGWRDEFAGWKAAWRKDQTNHDIVIKFEATSDIAVDGAVDALQTALRQDQVRISAAPEDAVLAAQAQVCLVARRQVGQRVIRSLAPSADGGSIECVRALMLAQHARLDAVSKGWQLVVAADPLEAVW